MDNVCWFFDRWFFFLTLEHVFGNVSGIHYHDSVLLYQLEGQESHSREHQTDERGETISKRNHRPILQEFHQSWNVPLHHNKCQQHKVLWTKLLLLITIWCEVFFRFGCYQLWLISVQRWLMANFFSKLQWWEYLSDKSVLWESTSCNLKQRLVSEVLWHWPCLHMVLPRAFHLSYFPKLLITYRKKIFLCF